MKGGLLVNLQIDYDKDKLFVKVSGELDMLVAPSFRFELDKALDVRQVRHLILDFTQVTFIDSSGLGVILGRYKRLAEVGGKVQICGVNEQISKILEFSGLNRIMEICQHNDSLSGAIS